MMIDINTLKNAIPDTRVSMFENCRECTLLSKEEILRIIDSLPEIEAEPVKHARWVTWNFPGDEHCYCTECEQRYDLQELYLGGYDYPKYCPNCGARMDGENETD